MSNIESISLNVLVTKLDKSKFYKGEKGLYANLVLWPCEEGSESSEYGDYIVKQKGERGDRMPILGNAKIFRKKGGNNDRRTSRRREDDEGSDEIPF
jgi:hypothetical protein